MSIAFRHSYLSSHESIFVGREAEMALLHTALQEAGAGQGSVVVLLGEPGIGKTRTAEELGRLAVQRGAQVWWDRCYEGGGAPAHFSQAAPLGVLSKAIDYTVRAAQHNLHTLAYEEASRHYERALD
jgi:predicted ATPase